MSTIAVTLIVITLALLAFSMLLVAWTLRAHRLRIEELEKPPPLTFAEVRMHLDGLTRRDVQ